MNRINRNHYSSMFLLPAIYYILLCVQILNAYDEHKPSVTISQHFHKANCLDDYDITTIYRLADPRLTDSNGLLDGSNATSNSNYSIESIEIHSRTNAIGIPILIGNQIDNNSLSDAILQFNLAEFYKYGFMPNNSRMGVYLDSNYWKQSTILLTGDKCAVDSVSSTTSYNTEYKLNECIDALEYKYDKHFYPYSARDDIHQTFLKIHWKPAKKQTCLSITYYHSWDSEMEIIMSISNENDTLITSSILEKKDSIMTLKVTDMALIQDQKYKMLLKRKYSSALNYNDYNSYLGNWFELIRISQCSDEDEEEVRVVSINDIGHWFEGPKPFNIFGNDDTTVCNKIQSSTKYCLNGGFVQSTRQKCVCPPGFKGQFCEIGCGSNFYGADCNGACSMHANEMCRGLLMCTKYYGCTCPVGLTGPLCNKDCKPGTYGADCKQTCSSNCHNNKCDQYTGICYHGCSQGYLPPYCLQRYPYLINPPILLSSKYDSLEMELNFKLDNIKGGDTNIKLKYYQIFYKPKIEDEFTKSEIKLINETSDGTIDILNDLIPDTTYMIGVLIITDDGNFNRENIVYGQYKTSHCIQPEITDYNIKLISGIKSVNITWNEIIPKQLECKITEYVITLTFNQTQNKMSGVKEIKSSFNTSHLIENLYPGYNYSTSLTPKTTKGPLRSSPTYSFTPLMTENDVSIKDIVVTTYNKTIKISWKLGNAYRYDATVNKPIKCVLRYKLQRILSCSMDEIKNDWTSTTIYNRTNYEIFDVIPNSQYCIQVTVANNLNTVQRENHVCTLTPASYPMTKPVFDLQHPMNVTNSSVFVQWKVDPVNCSKLNGLLSTYYIELKDKGNNILQVKETKKNYIYINNLKSNNYYELKVFIKTHIGYNPEQYLFTNFTTKSKYLVPVYDIVAYKKSLRHRSVGLRWYYLEDANLNGFIVSINEDGGNANNVIVIAATKCSAWPEYYCHNFNNLNPANTFTFNIKPKLINNPEGGKVSSITFKMIDELPDSPNNFKVIDIGKTFMTLKWDIPWIFNGVLDMFIINVEEMSDMNLYSSMRAIELAIYEEVPSYNYTLKNLNPGSTYSIGIVSVSKSLWYSLPSTIHATTLFY
ncbi:uncharacterized protein LOC100161662 isoform X1 [Acyrthosiphon pisum]|uniref:Uncharacterized protein n=2 Tax=Acyrthosiphon pisum TaxID=7029 RepID=A0A8R2H6G8_ACYPI|nr:uncharacterized protein LOC100161662 isoform X1 [Acyrthosiphon pisum]|eukprot:XP_016657825.1 PREDICTED: uncharacterized protein LOC100161662 isoform X1 [Acyrthosiphon pisum]